ncbi:MAG: hypothetical protein M0Z51_04470 [Propionibacterium sp.]|nr:hypothetical protein [Propionibacterium sp.]
MTPAPAQRAPGLRPRPVRCAVWAGVTVLVLVLVAAVALEARSLVVFHTVAPWVSPERIHFCGRDYLKGAVVSPTAARDAAGAVSWRQLTRGPLLQPVYGHPASAQQRSALGIPCAMVLYLREGDGNRTYGLSGGP